MLIRTILTRVFRFIRLMVTSIVALFKSSEETCSLDIETGMLAEHASDMEEIEIESSILSQVIDIRRQSEPTPKNPEWNDLYERRLSRRVSVHPVKSRIIDATSKNVRDRRFSVLKSVVITGSTMTTTAIPCSVKVEFLPELPVPGLSPLSSALKVLKSSKNRVVQFGKPPFYLPKPSATQDIDVSVLTPTILADTEISSRASHVGASSIEDLFDLFPSPPLHLPIQAAASAQTSVADPSVHEHFSVVVPPTPLQHPEACFTSTIRPESLFFSMEASPSLYSVYTASPLQLTCDLLRTSSRIASVVDQDCLAPVYPANTERSILVDIPDFDTSMEKQLVSCRGELPNDSEIAASSVFPTQAIDEATSSCALVSPDVSSNDSPPVSTHSLSSNARETEIDVIILETRNTSTCPEAQPRAIDSGSYKDVHPPSWRQSMEKILQAVQDTKPEDQDFGDQFTSAFCRSIRSDNVLDASCLSGTSRTDFSCSSQLADYTKDDAIATPLSLSSVESDMLSTPVLGSILEPVIELAQSPEGSLSGVHEALLRSRLPGITHGDVIIHLGAAAAAKDTSFSPSQDLLLRMLDRLVAMDGDISLVSSESDQHLPSFFTGD